MSNPGLKRYDFYNPGSIPLVQSDNGQYVLFSDVELILAALERANDLIQDLDSSYWNQNNDEDYKYYIRALSKLGMGE